MSLRENQTEFVQILNTDFPGAAELSRADIIKTAEKHKQDIPYWLLGNKYRTKKRGIFSIPSIETNGVNYNMKSKNDNLPDSALSMQIETTEPGGNSLIPPRMSGYVPFGNYDDLAEIIKSFKFYPTYVTGLSGNGKTFMIEQICAKQKREMIRVNITTETDEDDLIGGFRLVNGATVWHNGPVVTAMEKGAILLLDEVDLGSSKLMCLQPVLEGKPIFVKKINKLIVPSKGFNIVATANTKGKGSEDGRFIGTQVMNEAFLERFSITMDQEYPPPATEEKILNNVLDQYNFPNPEFVKLLVKWAKVQRKSFDDQAISEVISTRRLVHIVEAFVIFKDKMKAITLCLNRFDQETKISLLDLYTKVDAEINAPPKTKEQIAAEEAAKAEVSKGPKEGDEIPF
jgi:MoxR-like ATPase